jgi:hypothetical protein
MAYDDPDGLIAAAVIMQALVLLMISSRFVSHRMNGIKIHTSDYLIIVAGILSTALAIEQIYCTYFNLATIDLCHKASTLLRCFKCDENVGNKADRCSF